MEQTVNISEHEEADEGLDRQSWRSVGSLASAWVERAALERAAAKREPFVPVAWAAE